MSGKKASAAAPETRSARKASTQQRVLRAALQVFAARGFEAASTAEIAKLAGVAHGTVFAVAPTKESLVVAAYADDIRRAGESVAATLPKTRPLAVQVDHVLTALFNYYAANPPLSRAIIQHLLFIPEPAAKSQHEDLLKQFMQILRYLVDAAKARGEIRAEVQSGDLATLIFSTYLVFLLSLLNDAYPDRASHRRDYLRVLDLSLRAALVQPNEK
jgi:AcrR family transcriptional regulator